MEGEEDHAASQVAPPAPTANPDMNQLTIMLQQGMSIDEVAKSMNIKLDEQTYELLTTLKQQLDLAAALAKQSALSQAVVAPVGLPGEVTMAGAGNDVGKTYDYSVQFAAGNSAVGGNNGTVYMNDISQKPGSVGVGDYSQDFSAQNPAYPAGGNLGDGGGDPYTNYESRNMDISNDSVDMAVDSSSRERLHSGGAEFGGYGADGVGGYGEYGREGLDKGVGGYTRYSGSEGRPGAQKQYSYGSDSESAQRISSHRNSNSSNYSNTSGPGIPILMDASPPFRKTEPAAVYSHQGDVAGATYNSGRSGGSVGKYRPVSSRPEPRPLLSFEAPRPRGAGSSGSFRGNQYNRDKW